MDCSLYLTPGRQPHRHVITQFLQAGCSSWCPTNTVKALKANDKNYWMQSQGAYKSSVTNFQEISRIHFFLNSRRFFTWQAIQYQNAGEVCNVWRPPTFKFLVDIYRAGMLTPEIIVILFTQGLSQVQCTKNRLTCENYSYKTIPPVWLETSGGMLSTMDMVVQRRHSPRRLRDHDDDEY